MISEAQEWQSTARVGRPAGPGEEGLGAEGLGAEGLEAGTLANLPAPGAVGEDDGRRGAMWLLLAALLLGAMGRGTAGLSRGRTLRAEDAPRLGSKFLRAGRRVPAALRTGAARRAGVG